MQSAHPHALAWLTNLSSSLISPVFGHRLATHLVAHSGIRAIRDCGAAHAMSEVAFSSSFLSLRADGKAFMTLYCFGSNFSVNGVVGGTGS